MESPADLIRHCASGDPTVQRVVRDAGDVVGEAIAVMCNVLNPRRVVISGTLARISDDVLAAIRIAAYQTARPLATRHVSIVRSVLGGLDGVAGAMSLGVREWLGPDHVFDLA
jgi:glucokinase